MRKDTLSSCSSLIRNSLNNSSKLPIPSQNYSQVMLNLPHCDDIKQTQSCDDVTKYVREEESGGRLCSLLGSLSPQSDSRIKGKRSVSVRLFHFEKKSELLLLRWAGFTFTPNAEGCDCDVAAAIRRWQFVKKNF